MSEDMSVYFSGKKLYGDDLTEDQIVEWFNDEAEGYANLGASDRKKYQYAYHEVNNYHGYDLVKNRHFTRVLGLGSAYGDEFIPIIHQIDSIVILDPSDSFSGSSFCHGVPCKYRKPNIDGTIEFDSFQFDLITSFGVLHHIPNVSRVMAECYRCLNSDGVMLLREPIVSMGDWTKPRWGLTRRERGIPLDILIQVIENCGFKIHRKALWNFPIVPRLANKIGVAAYNNKICTSADSVLSRLFAWNIKYHRTKIRDKFAPASAFFVLKKR